MHKVTKLNSASVARLLQAHSSTMTGVTAGRVRSLSSGASVEHPAPPPRAPQGNEVSLFGPKDQRLPLPGDVGIPPSELRPEFTYRTPLERNSRHLTELDIYGVELSEDRQRKIYSRLVNETPHGPDLSETEGISQLGPGLNWEARECPLLMKKDFQELFPQYDIITMPLTVITVTQRTEYDNTLWSEEGDCERQRITENFVIMARKVVRQLTAAGYWADFIDPSSGRPYLSPRYLSVAALYETDESRLLPGPIITHLDLVAIILDSLSGQLRSAFPRREPPRRLRL
ncbi:methylmalonic aciduria and homocystinuria type D homolog, mitochondrial-like isoform X2 [Varroa destructor]|uniref:Uncharacterized protein n=1 Tax=Varroa destructor TaxID=109461 RepID=A0A7M7K4L8_VARDE|nr:methylmalonic aciduria and homocystinuria type D homolog, mitochondrial-like isoform X2 [Varroa destructor]